MAGLAAVNFLWAAALVKDASDMFARGEGIIARHNALKAGYERRQTYSWLEDNGWEWKSPRLRQVGYLPYFCEYLQADSLEPYSVFAASVDTLVSQMGYSWALRTPQDEFKGKGWLARVRSRLE